MGHFKAKLSAGATVGTFHFWDLVAMADVRINLKVLHHALNFFPGRMLYFKVLSIGH